MSEGVAVTIATATWQLRVMTWNVWWRFDARDQVIVGPPPPAGDGWRHREPGIVATLRSVRPDIVGLQEVWATAGESQAQRFADELGLHAAFGAPSLPPAPHPPRSPDHDGVAVGVAVLSRWPIVDVRRHLLPSGQGPGTVALAVTVDHPGGPLHVVSCCIDWELELAAHRMTQTRALAALLADLSRDGPLPTVLTADLNAPPTTAEIRVLTDVMIDAWIAGGRAAATGHTLSSSNPLAPLQAWQLDHRIDYVLVRPGGSAHPVSIERAWLAGGPRHGLYPSDHYAVAADIRVTAQPGRLPG
jgi:endonuclease/exonuclease/phosphatase family metal-dependent hydrolase